MALTLAKWEEHFATLDKERRDELRKAIETLENDTVFKEQFGWTGLFSLKFSFTIVDIDEERKAKNARKSEG